MNNKCEDTDAREPVFFPSAGVRKEQGPSGKRQVRSWRVKTVIGFLMKVYGTLKAKT